MDNIKILNENSIDVMSKIGDESVDLIITDPPYPTTKRGGTGNSGGMCKKKEFSSGKVFKHNDIKPQEYIPEFYRILKEGTHCYIMTNHVNLYEILTVAKETGFHFIKSLIWNKGNKIMGQAYMSQFEYILFFRKGKFKKINKCGTADILDIPNKKTKDEDGKNLHDTEKPIELMKILVENSSQEGEIVLDPFLGIGATGLACKELNRKFVGVELDENYFNIAKNRIESKLD
ncbi:site-specific DNA-methyltransferase [Clostridium sp.]|uniref:DNA-methyltransferase n=1 Tax=Clostridium sp. TaxID=1506 RepID=UPI001E16D160|nr:site-specific DNA-methyltransferase [Clostridium sp.]MBS5307661.1 site-specific DNA-methyltransferase [Clostridium sp.]